MTAVSVSADDVELVDDVELADEAEPAVDAELAEDVAEDWHPAIRATANNSAEKPMYVHLFCDMDFMAPPPEMKP